MSKEVKAIGAYTDDQYRLMNPAGAGGGGWLAGQMTKKGKQADEKSVTEALEINKVINEVAADRTSEAAALETRQENLPG